MYWYYQLKPIHISQLKEPNKLTSEIIQISSFTHQLHLLLYLTPTFKILSKSPFGFVGFNSPYKFHLSVKTNSICVSYLQYHSAKNALIPGGCEMILNTTQDPVSIHYHSSDYSSFVFWIRDLIPQKTYVYIYISLLYFIGF